LGKYFDRESHTTSLTPNLRHQPRTLAPGASAGVAPICTESVDPLKRVDCVFGTFVDHPLKIRAIRG